MDKVATEGSMPDLWGVLQIVKNVLHIRTDQNLWAQDGPLAHYRVQNKRRFFRIRIDSNPWIEGRHLAHYRMQTNRIFKLGEAKNFLDQFVILNPWEIPWNWIAFHWNSFVMTPDLVRGDTGGLANEAYWSKSVVSSKQ